MTKFGLIAGTLLYLAMIVLGLRPTFDMEVANFFYRGAHHFVGDTPAGVVVRYTAWAIPFVMVIVMAALAGLRRFGRVAVGVGPSGRSLLFLFATLLVAPGIMVHATLKEVSHRPRPYDVTRFGGADAFRPWYSFDGACRSNCAFPSGETAAASWTLAPASLAPPPIRAAALGAALVFAIATGAFRMAFGAHFLSDVCGAMLITIAVVTVLRSVLVSSGDARTRRDAGRQASGAAKVGSPRDPAGRDGTA